METVSNNPSHPIPYFVIPHFSKWSHYPSDHLETLTPHSSSLIHHQILSIQNLCNPCIHPLLCLLSVPPSSGHHHVSRGLLPRVESGPGLFLLPHFSHRLPINGTKQLYWITLRSSQVLCPVTCLVQVSGQTVPFAHTLLHNSLHCLANLTDYSGLSLDVTAPWEAFPEPPSLI